MALFEEDDIVEQKRQPTLPEIAAPEYRGATVDTRYTYLADLITHISGYRWSVDYYRQVVDKDDELAGQQLTRLAAHQQYDLIKEFELRVDTPLDTSQDDEMKTMSVTGSAHVYPFVIPNAGDMFLADVGDGREGLFEVTASNKLSMYKEAVYHIEYKLVDYATATRRLDLDRKVVQTYYYRRDFLEHGQHPLLIEEEHFSIKSLEQQFKHLSRQYYQSHFSHEFKTIIVSGQEFPTYDHALAKFVRSLFKAADDVNMDFQQLRLLNVDDDRAMDCYTIFDAIMRKDKDLLKYAVKRVGLTLADVFSRNPVWGGIKYSGIKYVVYPKDPEVVVDLQTYPVTKVTLPDKKMTTKHLINNEFEEIFTESLLHGLPIMSMFNGMDFEGLTPEEIKAYQEKAAIVKSLLLKQVNYDEYYVFSKAFYSDGEDQSCIEFLVNQYLKDRPIDPAVLKRIIESQHRWGSLERTYYIPILLYLIWITIRQHTRN